MCSGHQGAESGVRGVYANIIEDASDPDWGSGREAGVACQPVVLLGVYFCLCVFESYMLKINNHYSKR